jgi:N-sulfoglucosamine sulfohydrolase
LIVTADDLNYNSIGAFGCPIPGITPNIDKLAAGGIRFTNAHTNTAVCQPCRQSIMTGRYAHNNGAEGFEPINPDVPTLPEQLNKAGYLNGILGKEIHHQPREKYFWDFIPFATEPDSIWRKGHSRTPELFNKYSLEFFTMAKEQGKPFFLIANSHDPHRPFVGSASDTATWGDNMPPVTRQFSPEEIEMLGYLPDIPLVRKEVAQYYGTVYRCDQNIGAVLDALEESGMAENTMVIFLSDHGASFPFAKSQCYLNSTKTPWIVRWPGKVKAGAVDSTHFISGIDIMPTILEALNLPMVPQMDGRSYLPILSGEDQENRSDVFTTYYQIFARIRYPMRCVQNENFGYIFNFWSNGEAEMRGDAMGGITWRAMVDAAENDEDIARRVELYKHRVPEEFYDFKNDPDALNNLIDNPAYEAEINKLRARMAELMEKYHDPALEAFKNREKPGAIGEFMEQQRERAKMTKPVERF